MSGLAICLPSSIEQNEESNGNEARFLILTGYGEKVKQICEDILSSFGRAVSFPSTIRHPSVLRDQKALVPLRMGDYHCYVTGYTSSYMHKCSADDKFDKLGLEAAIVTEVVLDSPDRHNYLKPSPSRELQGLHAPRQPHCANVVMNHSSRRCFLT
ncbi:hypothetical protein C8R45DRAFT_833508 [Mycena sanguinolenta]|nr:hypothetical protein C8R45DRAFT_833508 [Mycena sanguinolenta]